MRLEHVAHQVREQLGFELLHAARRHRRRADADAARDERLLRVVRHRVLVDRDVRLAERGLGVAPGQVLRAQVDQEEMAVGAPGDDAKAALVHDFRHHARVVEHLLLVVLEFARLRFLEAHRLRRDHVHQRTALQTREDRRVDHFLVLRVREDQPAARTAQRLVRGAS